VPNKPFAAFAAVLFVLPLIGALTSASAGEQQAAGAAGGTPVTVEFRAVTTAGSPVNDLKVTDITLKVAGRERVIKTFDLIQLGDAPVPDRNTVPSPFATNALRVSGTRDTVLVIDDESIAPGDETRLRLALDQYLSGIGVGDRVGIVTVMDRGGNVSLTNDRDKLRAAMKTLVGRARTGESADDAACRTRRSLGALISVAQGFPPGGLPVTVLFFTTGLTPPGTATMSRMGGSATTPTSVCEVQPRDYQQFADATLETAASIYVVSAALSSSTTLQSGMENLSGISGNPLVQLVRGGDSDIVRVARENSAWYRVAFVPEANERSGSVQRVDVQVKRSGVESHARPQVLIPKATPSSQVSIAKDMLREAKVHRDFEFRAAAYSSQEVGSDKVKLVVLFEPTDPTQAVKSAVVGLFDQKGKLVVQGTAEAANLTRAPATLAILANPGVYRMRVAAVDAAGHGGTVDADVDVSLTRAGSIQMGSLILGVADGGSFAGRLTFGAEPAAIGYLEVYGLAPGAKLSAVLEISQTVGGPAVTAGATKILGDGADGRRVILGGVPIDQLPAGDVVLRMVVSLDGKPVGQVTRTLRKRSK